MDKVFWHLLKNILFGFLAFFLAFPLHDYATAIVYPSFASVEILVAQNFTEGNFAEFFKFVVYLMTAYFIFSFFYFLENLYEYLDDHRPKKHAAEKGEK